MGVPDGEDKERQPARISGSRRSEKPRTGPHARLGITLHIQRISNEVLRVEEGSLYPALHRMEQDRWIASEWGASENNRRARFYRLTTLGRKQLTAERENWQKITSAVALVLAFGKA
jgi:PadR family transcriptional regulator, regulatory protein PadR